MDFVFFIVFFQLAIDYPHTFLFEYFEIMYLSNKEIPKLNVVISCGFSSVERIPDLAIYAQKVRKSNFSDHKIEITSDNKVTAKTFTGE